MGQGWLLLEISGSPFLVGLAPGLAGVVALGTSPFSGLLADRYNRRNIIFVSLFIMCFAIASVAALTLTGHVASWHLLVAAGINGLAGSLMAPSRTTLTYCLVGKENVVRAMTALYGAASLAVISGPLAGGLILTQGNPWLLFLLVAFSLLLAAMAVWGVAAPPLTRRVATGFGADLKEGFAYAAREPTVRSVLLVILVVESFGYSVMALLPVAVRDLLHGDAWVLGSLTAIWGFGGLVASLVLSKRLQNTHMGTSFLLSSALFGAFLMLFAISRSIYLSLVLLFLVGAAGVIYNSMANSLLQVLPAPHLRGRTASIQGLLSGGMNLGSLGLGAVAEFRGIALAIGMGGAVVACNAVLFLRKAKAINARGS